MPIQVEIDTVEQLRQCLQYPEIDAVLLDNMDPATIKECIGIIKEKNQKIFIEVSGGITLKTLNRFLINKCDYNPFSSNVIAISPETRCKFRKSLRYPEKVEAGLSTFKIGVTSVIYDISLFKVKEDIACAEGYFVHVFVKKSNMEDKVKVPEKIRKELESLTFKP